MTRCRGARARREGVDVGVEEAPVLSPHAFPSASVAEWPNEDEDARDTAAEDKDASPPPPRRRLRPCSFTTEPETEDGEVRNASSSGVETDAIAAEEEAEEDDEDKDDDATASNSAARGDADADKADTVDDATAAVAVVDAAVAVLSAASAVSPDVEAGFASAGASLDGMRQFLGE